MPNDYEPDLGDLEEEVDEGGGDGTSIALTDEELEAVDELKHVRAEIASYTKRAKDLRVELLQRLGGATFAHAADGTTVLKVRRQVSVKVDRDELRAKYPDIFDECSSEKETIILDTP
jgi:predicted phage-related endonuclease